MGEVIYAPVVCTLYLNVLWRFVKYTHSEIEPPRRGVQRYPLQPATTSYVCIISILIKSVKLKYVHTHRWYNEFCCNNYRNFCATFIFQIIDSTFSRRYLKLKELTNIPGIYRTRGEFPRIVESTLRIREYHLTYRNSIIRKDLEKFGDIWQDLVDDR